MMNSVQCAELLKVLKPKYFTNLSISFTSCIIDNDFIAIVDNIRDTLLQAIDHWQNKTCIRFREKTRRDKDFVWFTSAACGYM